MTVQVGTSRGPGSEGVGDGHKPEPEKCLILPGLGTEAAFLGDSWKARLDLVVHFILVVTLWNFAKIPFRDYGFKKSVVEG